MNTTNTSANTRKLICIASLAAISTLLMFVEMPLPLMPPFLKLDISSVPIMIGSFMFGPIAGMFIAAIKALIHLLSTQTAGVGEFADFIMTSSFAVTAGLIYKYKRNKQGALLASVASIVVVIVVSSLTNYFILIPFYAMAFMPLDTIISVCQAINPKITDVTGYIIWGVVPFNFIKGLVIAVLTFLLYKRISILMHRFTEKPLTKKETPPAKNE